MLVDLVMFFFMRINNDTDGRTVPINLNSSRFFTNASSFILGKLFLEF